LAPTNYSVQAFPISGLPQSNHYQTRYEPLPFLQPANLTIDRTGVILAIEVPGYPVFSPDHRNLFFLPGTSPAGFDFSLRQTDSLDDKKRELKNRQTQVFIKLYGHLSKGSAKADVAD
jgi:hypothetical protein